MKNLFIISEEEKKRILGLHESAAKRQYLSEQESEETKLRKSLNPIANEITMIVPGNRFVNVDETKLINAILKIPDVNTLNAVNNDLKRYYSNKAIKYTGLDAVIADSIGAFDSGKERLRPHLQKLLGRNSTQNLGTSNFKFPDLNTIMASQEQQKRDTTTQQQKTNTSATEKTTDTGQANPAQRVVPTSIEQLSQKGYYLRKGDKGNLVKIVQNKLLDAGEEVSVTSVFDDMTKQGVINFQTKNGLKADGIIGPKTWGILSKTQTQKMTTKDTEPLKSIAPSNVPADYGKTNQGVANPNQTPIRGTGRGSGLGNMEFNQP